MSAPKQKKDHEFQYLGAFYHVLYTLHDGWHYKVENYYKDDKVIKKEEWSQAYKEHQATQEDNPGMKTAPSAATANLKKLK